MAANRHDLIVPGGPAPELAHRYSFTTGVRAGQGYLQPDGSLTKSPGGGAVITPATAGLTLHHVALDCRTCGTAR